MCGRRFCSACSATYAGEITNGAAFAVTLRSIASPTLCSSGRKVDAGGGVRAGDSADTSASLNYCAVIGLRRSRTKNATGFKTEAALPKRHSVGLFLARLFSSLRVANSAVDSI